MPAKRFYIFALLLCPLGAIAQRNINGLINAEKNFAVYAVSAGTRDAFLQNADTSAIVFVQSKPHNAIEFWTKREKRPGILNWQPAFAEISLGGDMGYTTGPYTFQPKTVQDSVIATGSYLTIWMCDASGTWKFILDDGIQNAPAQLHPIADEIQSSKFPGPNEKKENLINEETSFNLLYSSDKRAAYKKYLSDHSILYRDGSPTAISTSDQLNVLENTPADLKFSATGSRISSSGDIGFTYGTLLHNGKESHFIHIWRKELSGWKIAVEVLHYQG